MDEKDLEKTVYILSFPDCDLWEPAQHILGFFSEERLAEEQKDRMIKAGLNKTPYDVSKRNISQLIEGSNKLYNGIILEADLSMMRSLDEHEYPWIDMYLSQDEILEILDKTELVDRFLQRWEQHKIHTK